MVIVEFPSLDQAKRWYESDEYAQLKPIRHEHADSEVIFVEGLQPG